METRLDPTAGYGIVENVIVDWFDRMEVPDMLPGMLSGWTLIPFLDLNRRIRNAAKTHLASRVMKWLSTITDEYIPPDMQNNMYLIYKLQLLHGQDNYMEYYFEGRLNVSCEECSSIRPLQGLTLDADITLCTDQCYHECGQCGQDAVEIEIDRFDMEIGDLAVAKCHACRYIGFAKLIEYNGNEPSWDIVNTDGS